MALIMIPSATHVTRLKQRSMVQITRRLPRNVEWARKNAYPVICQRQGLLKRISSLRTITFGLPSKKKPIATDPRCSQAYEGGGYRYMRYFFLAALLGAAII